MKVHLSYLKGQEAINLIKKRNAPTQPNCVKRTE